MLLYTQIYLILYTNPVLNKSLLVGQRVGIRTYTRIIKFLRYKDREGLKSGRLVLFYNLLFNTGYVFLQMTCQGTAFMSVQMNQRYTSGQFVRNRRNIIHHQHRYSTLSWILSQMVQNRTHHLSSGLNCHNQDPPPPLASTAPGLFIYVSIASLCFLSSIID